jgi:alkylation response protein AidB-like acyl-CoA dehydrogenase
MDFTIPAEIQKEEKRFRAFLDEEMMPHLGTWYRDGEVPRAFHERICQGGWIGFEMKDGRLAKRLALREATLGEIYGRLSPGVAVATLAHADLGIMALWLWGSDELKKRYAGAALSGKTLMCLGNTESGAGSDVANIAMRAEKIDGGWRLNGTKAYVTGGLISDMAVVTAISDPDADRNKRLSMYLVDLKADGVTRKKLNKQVWIPSDLTRIQLHNTFVPDDHLMGERGRGLRQVLTVFTHSRVPISGLCLGTAMGAFETAMDHAKKRMVLGKRIVDHQAKAFEMADFYARMEAARVMLWKACWTMDQGGDFRFESSTAKYLSVMIAREVTSWAADLFGAASVVFEHPIHKFPMDAWAASLGEGTQDVLKLVIFREITNRYGG